MEDMPLVHTIIQLLDNSLNIGMYKEGKTPALIILSWPTYVNNFQDWFTGLAL